VDKRALFSVLLLALACGSPAMAQDRTPPMTADDLIKLHKYAACVADGAPRRAATVLTMEGDDEAREATEGSFFKSRGECLGRDGGKMRSSSMLALGGVAERLLTRQHLIDDLPARVAAAPTITARNDSEVVGLCAVRTAPDQARAALLTAPQTPEELQALQAIGPVLAGCLRKDQQVKFNRPGMRAMIAVAAFRLVQPAASPAQGN
jgi:hypothetical protein